MRNRVALILALAVLSACKPAEDTRMKAIIGAVLIDGMGGPPLSNSVVVTAGEKIRAAGPASTVPIPAEADKIDGSGKFLVPAIVDVYDGSRARVPGIVHLFEKNEAEFEKAREDKAAIIGHFSTQAEMQWMIANGATALVGMVRDTTTLDHETLVNLRDLGLPVAPMLLKAGNQLDTASHNTGAMFAGGVRMALATGGGDPVREAELLAGAGIPAFDLVAIATEHGAAALRRGDIGAVVAGRRADLLLLSANPGEDVRNWRKVALAMTAGEIR
jgi:imidazolonepropionase-like amidohydrolase